MEIPPCGKTKHSSADTLKINTKNILFIFGGAFAGLTRNYNITLKIQKNAANEQIFCYNTLIN